ncbi:MAG: bifunctional 2-C-methyl-D-erythritol 4-phosphate cytidylyltransferase/2-C-methyl-D-erythritol 2,4-cyclodiphosphate synthase [Alphaproteobacteria bacterium]|nr:bifunctional 2-C-methyl-D-erythritol 4-phosphate cytidylyltransferase/2-C-methyl-D-erythritol 2,4-cyclodiphosphate synthase [Alphaproteobacteria bacterium]MBV9692461.1 bifunctional 2-C-methyl-D-erythritol 4-phosphate cytidylyltransferase/2-C-methyl-D-erythritol 2,4-cyclodiphosphate synthase [Alphaproteobacteria bacterium]
MPRIAALIVAAGRGERAGAGLPKQYVPLMGKPVLRWSVEAFAGVADMIQVVIGADDAPRFAEALRDVAVLPPLAGGATRQHSVMHGLEALAHLKPDAVLIHDAARPLVGRNTIDAVIAALDDGADAAVPLLSVADTLRRLDDGHWTTVPREGVLRAQTPQGFRFEKILKAHRDHKTLALTDDMALAELAGLAIVQVSGEETNLKITTPPDFASAERLLSARLGDARTGFGFDAHRFVAGDHVWLCGVKVPHERGLEGHSDADAGLHALTDAILGACGEGDIGVHFPPGDERWRGAPSWKFLDHAAGLVHAKGAAVTHCDVTLICERPKIGPHREAMRARVAEILKLDVSRVSVKATTTEGMGFTGRGEGLAAQAVATVRLP